MSEKNKYICIYCDFIASSKANLYSHSRKHKEERKYVCSECSSSFKDNYLLTRHFKRAHRRIIKFFCKDCDFKTHDKNYLLIHNKRKHQPHDFECFECEKTFPRKIDLKYHIDAKHKNNIKTIFPLNLNISATF